MQDLTQPQRVHRCCRSVQMATKSKLAQISLIFACGTALFSDGYASGVIGSVNTILRRTYGADNVNAHNYSIVLTSLSFVGTIIGMLTFGYLSDKMGRKFGMMAATGIIAVFSALSAASSGAHHSLHGLLSMLSVCRLFLGIGIGAEYSSGSVAASEQSEAEGIGNRLQHGWFVLATNTIIDFGFVIAAFVPLVLFWIFGDNHLRAVWRLSLGLGVVPALALFIWRLRMDEPTHYKRNSMASSKVPYWLILKRYWIPFSGLASVWFLYDFIVYPFNLYSSTVVDSITHNDDSLTVVLGWNVVINLFYMPGTVLGACVVDYIGPKRTMISGLLAQALVGFIISGLYTHLTKHVGVFAVVYGIFLSLGEFGPGNCLPLLGSKAGPTAVRGQFYGTAAAIGKLGAFVGTWAFPPMIEAFGGAATTRGNTGPFWVGSGLAILSAIIIFFTVQPLDHDGILKEDEAFREYLEQHGYNTAQMGILHDTESIETTPSVIREEVLKKKAQVVV
ncbi:unnamed protein product [Somion occarium]|uniref:Major facilitator superfamily (MFS) profile domain-containing protein n=1 Tax=Somion occarium TaxID=3059160 RepID=A0ABP1D1I8_9APHY